MKYSVNGEAPDSKELSFSQSPLLLIGDVAKILCEDLFHGTLDRFFTTRTERRIIMELAKKDGRTQFDIVRKIRMKAPTVSVSLQKMEKNGYVYRVQDKIDQRSTRVYLSEKAKEIISTLEKNIASEQIIANKGFTESDITTLCKLLRKVKENLSPEDGAEETVI